MTLDLHTLEKIRAEVEGMKKEIHNPHISHEEEDYIYNQALTDLLTYLDTEIAKAKNHE